MDRPGNTPPSSPSSRQDPPSEPLDKNDDHSGRHDHREITSLDQENIVARATATAGKDEQLRQRCTTKSQISAKQMQQAAVKVKKSRAAIEDFIRSHGMDRQAPKIACNAVNGFAPSARTFLGKMRLLKQLIDDHIQNLNNTYQVLTSDYRAYRTLDTVVRNLVKKIPVSAERLEMLDKPEGFGDLSQLSTEYWKERQSIMNYACFTSFYVIAIKKTLPQLEVLLFSPIFSQRIEEFLPITLESMKVYQEVMLCQLRMGEHAQLEKYLRVHDSAATCVAALLSLATPHYFVESKLSVLRHLALGENGCFVNWLEQYDPEQPQVLSLNSWIIKNLITAAVIVDKPEPALRLLKFFRAQMSAGSSAFAPVDCFHLCQYLHAALPALYYPEEPLAEYKIRIEGAAQIVKELGAMILDIHQQKLMDENSCASLVVFFEQIDAYCQSRVDILHELEQGVFDRAEEIISEEEAEKNLIREKQAKRERKRQEREARQRQADWEAKQKAKTDQTEIPPPPPGIYDCSETLNEAAEAFASKQPIGVINAIYEKIINHPEASDHDKAQARYGYADMIASRLRRQLDILKTACAAIDDYRKALESDDIPELEKDIKFRKAVHLFHEHLGQASLNTLIISKTVRQALEAFNMLGIDQPDFLDALVDLHNTMDVLLADSQPVIKCSREITETYSRRGEMIYRHQLTGKGSSSKNADLVTRVNDLERQGQNLENNMGFLKHALNPGAVQKALVTHGRILEEPTEQPGLPKKPTVSVESLSDLAGATSLSTGIIQESGDITAKEPDQPVLSPLPDIVSSSPKHLPKTTSGIASPAQSTREALPLRLLMPSEIHLALGCSIIERELAVPMRLVEPPKAPEQATPEEEKSSWQTTSAQKRKKKSKDRRRKTASAPSPQAIPEIQPQAEPEPELNPGKLGLTLQTRLRNYLQTLQQSGLPPSGSPVPEQLNLPAILERVRAGTFLRDPEFFRHDFTLLADMLGMPVRVHLGLNETLYFKPGLVKPARLNLFDNPQEPYLNLEFISHERNQHWFASIEHYFRQGNEEDDRLLPEKKGKSSKK